MNNDRKCCGSVGAVLAILIVPILAVVGNAAEPADKAIGEVNFARGKVSIVSDAGVDRTVVVKAAVYRNDKVSCGAGSKLEIRFTDDSIISLGENSEIVVDEYVYAPDKKKDDVSFAMRLFKGACRLATGAITKLNPERFKVHTRMATVGIRGCELALKCKPSTSDVYVIKLGKGETVMVETTSNGKPVMDLATGRMLDIDVATRRVVNVDRPGTVVSIVEGKGFSQNTFEPAEIDAVTRDTSHLSPARYDSVYGSDSSTIQPLPPKAPSGDKEGGPK